MNKTITISRQFGSGGREIGKLLSLKLGIPYYDKQLLNQIAEKSGLAVEVVNEYQENISTSYFPYTFGSSFTTYETSFSDKVQIAQIDILKKLAQKKDGIFIGRSSNYVLREFNPLNIFIYSSNLEDRIERCYEKVPEDRQNKSHEEMEKEIKKIDKKRAKYYAFYTGEKWGEVTNYNLCIDTSKISIEKAVDLIIEALNA